MGLSEWMGDTVSALRTESPRYALKNAAHELYLGGVRRLSPAFPDGADFWGEEWDVLVLLDACRVDLMREACETASYEWLPERRAVESVRSPASSSKGWMEAHFDASHEDQVGRTGYVTSNLFVQDYPVERFPAFTQVGADLELAEGVRLVDPRKLTDRATDVWRRRNELGVDRLIVHYMQPHTPFRSRPEWFTDVDSSTGWGLGFVELRDGRFDRQDFWAAYLDNLQWVLEEVDALVHNCDADVAISSDHGNGFGEWGVYGHPDGIPMSVVRDVPWIEVEGRDEVSRGVDLPEDYLERDRTLEADAIADQLEALGYAD